MGALNFASQQRSRDRHPSTSNTTQKSISSSSSSSSSAHLISAGNATAFLVALWSSSTRGGFSMAYAASRSRAPSRTPAFAARLSWLKSTSVGVGGGGATTGTRSLTGSGLGLRAPVSVFGEAGELRRCCYYGGMVAKPTTVLLAEGAWSSGGFDRGVGGVEGRRSASLVGVGLGSTAWTRGGRHHGSAGGRYGDRWVEWLAFRSRRG